MWHKVGANTEGNHAMQDNFNKHSRSLTSPPENAILQTPSDDTILENHTRAIHIGGGGDLRVRMIGGEVVTLSDLAPNSMIPIRVRQIFATGTTATEIVALW